MLRARTFRQSLKVFTRTWCPRNEQARRWYEMYEWIFAVQSCACHSTAVRGFLRRHHEARLFSPQESTVSSGRLRFMPAEEEGLNCCSTALLSPPNSGSPQVTTEPSLRRAAKARSVNWISSTPLRSSRTLLPESIVSLALHG